MTHRKLTIAGGVLLALLVALGLTAVLYLSSDSFQQRARVMVIERLQMASGGRVEIERFRWSFRRMEVEMGDVTLHGREAAGQAPFLHVDRVFARVTIVSLFSRKLRLEELTIERPTLHLLIGPSGITNEPRPAQAITAPLFDVSIQRLQVMDARLLLNETMVPFGVNASQVDASLERAGDRYDGTLRARNVQATYASASSLKLGVEARFSAWPDRVEVKSSRWSTDRSWLEAKGTVDHFADPRLDVVYRGSLDVAEAAGFLKVQEARAGALDVHGRLLYGPQNIAADGKLAVRDLEWRAASVRAARLNGGAQYILEADRLRLSHLFATVFGGAVSGSVELRNWRSLFAEAKPPARHPLVGAANLRADGLQLREVSRGLQVRNLPLNKLAMAGRLKGSVDAHWIRSLSSVEANFNLDVAPPQHVADGELPVTARVRATYHGSRGTMDVPQLNVATRTTRIDATGVLGSSTANLRVAVNSTDISEFNPVLGAFGETAALAKLNGHASFNGAVTGKLKAPNVTGRLQINDFESLFTASVLGALPTPEAQHALPVHWDEMVADVALSPTRAEAHHAIFRRGKTRIFLDGTAVLHDWQFDRSSPLQIRGHLDDVSVADVEHFIGRNDPIDGRMTMKLELSGSLSDLHGGGHVQVTELNVGSEQFSSLSADLRFVGRESQWNQVVLRHDGATIQGTAAYQLDTAAFRFEATGRALDLSRVRSIQNPKYKVAGVADFNVSGSGTAAAPVINGSFSVKNVVVNGEPVGDIVATAITHGTEMQVKARAQVEEATFDLSGTAHLRDDWPVNLHVTTSDFDFDPLLRAYLGNRITGHSSMAGTADITGPVRTPRKLRVIGNISRLSAEVEKLRFRNPDGAPIEFALQDQVLTLKRAHLTAEDTDVITDGTIQLSGARELRLRSKGNVSMKLLQLLHPELRASGSTVFDVNIAGTIDRPDINGPAEVRNAALSFIDVPNGLSNLQGFLQFQHNRLVIESLAAKSGGGNLDVRGFLTYAGGLIFDLSVHSSEMRLRYPAGVSAIAAMDLRYAGSIPNSRLSGTVTITRFALNSRFDFAQYLASAKQPESVPQADSPLSNLHLDVHIVSASELQMQTSSAHLTGNVDLRLRGTAARPVLLGRVNVLEGDIMIAGTKYHIDRGDVTFNNPTRIEPVLNVEATARIRDYDVSLGVHGIPPDHLRSSYRSDPPLPESDVIALLALGRTGEESRLGPQPTQNYTETTSNAILGEALSETVSSRSQKLFGLARIKIDPQAGGPESNPNARLTIEQQVSDKVTLTYITNLSQSAQQIIQVEYNVDRNFTIIAVRDQNGVLGFDIRYRRRKR